MSVMFSFIDAICRFCSNKHATISLLSSPETKSEVNLLLDNIKFCLGLELQLENEPKTICELCKDKIEQFGHFKKLCLESEKNLQRPIKTEDTAVDTELFNDSNCVKVEICVDVNVENESKKSLDLKTDFLFSSSDSASNDDCGDDISPTEPTLHKNSSLKRKKITKKQLKPKKRKYIPKKTTTYCNICHIDLENADNFTKHNFECHGVEKDGLHRCLGCEKKFRTPKARASHELNFCKGLKDGYKCIICDRFLPRRGVYERHMRDHRKNVAVVLPDNVFKCLKCPASFNTKDSLKTHLESHVKKQFICETCGRAFSRQDYLHKHKKTHTGNRQYRCPHCDYRATQKSTLNVHIRKHTGERPYSCNICSQRCVNRSNLTAHLKRHAGIKSYECKICQKKFGYKSSLDDHIASTHERSVQHACRICGAIYTRLNGLRRHLSAKHGKKMRKSIEADLETNTDLNKDSVDKIIITQGEKDIYMKIVANDKEGSYVMKEDQIFVVESDISCKNTLLT